MWIYNGASVAGEKGPWGTSLLYEVSENEVHEEISVIRVLIFMS